MVLLEGMVWSPLTPKKSGFLPLTLFMQGRYLLFTCLNLLATNSWLHVWRSIRATGLNHIVNVCLENQNNELRGQMVHSAAECDSQWVGHYKRPLVITLTHFI